MTLINFASIKTMNYPDSDSDRLEKDKRCRMQLEQKGPRADPDPDSVTSVHQCTSNITESAASAHQHINSISSISSIGESDF